MHQNRLAHASKMSRFWLSYQRMLVSLPAGAGELIQNLVIYLRMRIDKKKTTFVSYQLQYIEKHDHPA